METKNEALKIAQRFNLWFRVWGVWYTRESFAHHYHDVVFNRETKKTIFILNPEEELTRGRQIINQWIREGIDPETLIKCIDKLGLFYREVYSRYKPACWTKDIQERDEVLQKYYSSPNGDRIIFKGWGPDVEY